MPVEGQRIAHVELPPTERRLPASMNLDQLSTLGTLHLLNDHDRIAVDAVRATLPELSVLVDETANRVRHGGVVHYFGAGTSGRLAVLDAAELLPTFNAEPGLVVAHIAGGARAVVHAVENAEDSETDGEEEAQGIGPQDTVIGLTASGSTPYVQGALRQARKNGAYTALVSSNPDSPIAREVDLHLCTHTGAEVVTGSTRLKAGTAEKLILNGFSTALMIALGRTWQNLMVSMVATNEKLRQRMVRILREATGLDESDSVALLEKADGELKVAIVCANGGVGVAEARNALESTHGSVRDALQFLN